MNMDTVKSDLSHFASDVIEHGQAAMHTPVSRATDSLASLSRVIAAAASARALSRVLSPEVATNWMLGAMDLRRRPSALSRFGTGFGFIAVGAAVGAGVALLLSPRTGKENREMLQRRVKSLRRDASKAVDDVSTRALSVAHDVEARAGDIAHDVKNAAQGAAQSLEAAVHTTPKEAEAPRAASPPSSPGTPSYVKPFSTGMSHPERKV
jgi:gas vesicle protein